MGQPIPWSNAGSIALDPGYAIVAVVGPERGQLLRNSVTGWELVMHLPMGEQVAFNPSGDVVTSDENGLITISDTKDPRLIASWSRSAPASPLATQFDGRWQNVEVREGYFYSLLGRVEQYPYLSDDRRWRMELTATGITISEAKDGNPVLKLPGHAAALQAAFARDNKSVAIETEVGVEVWSLDEERYRRLLCERLGEYAVTTIPNEWNTDAFRKVCRSDISQSWIRTPGAPVTIPATRAQ